ncbi:MAG: hypothetical protein LC778_20200 [Acidobacteria bacterium]|nr:hypothetical protein [Acidobacteriota bacterium]MCA1628133.1 hypothetical protein [Acidobacteriota bacterium]
MALVEKVCLYYREGASDKVYEIHLTQEEDGFLVTGYNGRRGTKLVAQSKTTKPVPYRTARYIFDNLEAAKLNHRRTPYCVASRERFDVPVNPASASTSLPPSTPPPAESESSADAYSATHLEALEF